MDLLSLIPAALSFLGGMFGGNKTTTTASTPANSPALEAAAGKLFTEAEKTFTKPYQQYTGDRTANATASRAALDPLMTKITGQVQGGMSDANGYQARIRSLMNSGPARVTVPSMVQGGAQVGYQPLTSPAPLPPMPVV